MISLLKPDANNGLREHTVRLLQQCANERQRVLERRLLTCRSAFCATRNGLLLNNGEEEKPLKPLYPGHDLWIERAPKETMKNPKFSSKHYNDAEFLGSRGSMGNTVGKSPRKKPLGGQGGKLPQVDTLYPEG